MGDTMKKRMMNKMTRKLRNRLILIMSMAMLLVVSIIFDSNVVYTKEHESIVEGLSNSLIRFHVIANSDLEEDQQLKIKVKDRVVEAMRTLLDDSESIDESREIIINNMDALQDLAGKVIKEEGYLYETNISLKKEAFPLKKYGDVVLPPGEYEALVIRIGEAKGKNWWCVLFPPLCFVDATHGVVDDASKEGLKEVLTTEEYQAVLMDNEKEVDVKVKFKLLDWLDKKEDQIVDQNLLVDTFNDEEQ